MEDIVMTYEGRLNRFNLMCKFANAISNGNILIINNTQIIQRV